jgi:GntR family transcriptional regulator/MocR family aminotransferase
LFEVDLELARDGERPTARRLHEQLRAAISDGRLGPGTRLPPTRQATAIFAVSRNTIVDVYDRLIQEGLAVTRHGSGTFVAEHVPRDQAVPPDLRAAPLEPRLNPFWLRPEVRDAMDFWRDGAGRTEGQGIADFRPALIDSRLFPLDIFRRVSAQQLRRIENRPPRFKSPQGNQGNFHLRTAIAAHIGVTRAVVCSADDILVTSGAQQAFDLLARVLVTPGETVVAIEDPGYPPMRVAFAAAGAILVPVGVDAEGMRVEDLPERVDVICVCPSHHFPLGMAMSADRRRALIETARHRGAVIVEDDYDGEFRYDGAPLTALRTQENADLVCYVGTFSKSMLPSLRLGFIVAPDAIRRPLVTARNALDWHSPIPIQMGAAAFIAEGHLTRHVRKMRGIYRRRRQRLLDGLRVMPADRLEAIASFYGMHVAAAAPHGLDLEQVAAGLGHQGIKLHSSARYHLGTPGRAHLVFGYGAVDLPAIDKALELLRQALRKI